MAPNMVQYLNRSILISIPALFDDRACRSFTLIGIELNGLWLQSQELNRRLLSHETAHFEQMEPVVFVPFAQIAGVLIPTGPPPKALIKSLEKPGEVEKTRGKHMEKQSMEHDRKVRPKRKDQ